LEDQSSKPLIQKTLVDFANVTASESPAPGGGSISAYVGSLGASLGTMVANLSSHKPGWDNKIDFFSGEAEKGQSYKNALIDLVDADTNAFNKILEAVRMPKATVDEKKARANAMHDATILAIEVPLQVMRKSFESLPFMKEMVIQGNPNSISDGAVGVLCLRTAIQGAYLNVLINCKDFDDTDFVSSAVSEAKDILQKAKTIEQEVLEIMDNFISK
jgi:glutamate formiminotransferase/formiminotetrahydrofolate cyclodeaminase